MDSRAIKRFISLLLLGGIGFVHGANISGDYLGQKLPGKTAEKFAPGVVSTEHWEAFGTFSPDLNEFYFIRKGGAYPKSTLVRFKRANNVWTEQAIGLREGEPVISYDGNTLFLGKKYKKRRGDNWSDTKVIGGYINDFAIMRLSASLNGTAYFDERTRDGRGGIRSSRLSNGEYEKPQLLNNTINSGRWTAHPFIAADESYLIFDSERPDGYGDSDLYISFKQKDGSWGNAINLGENINSEYEDAYGSVSPDGKVMFFYRYLGEGKMDIYWVDASFIKTLRP